MKIHVDYQDSDVPTVECEVTAIPQIGEKIGVRPSKGQQNAYYLDFVVDVRHYLTKSHNEIRVMTSSRP